MNATTLVILSMMAALGVVGVVAIVGVTKNIPQAEAAGCENASAVSIAVNASKGRCFGH